MTTFANAVRDTPTKTCTTNGMAALTSTCRANVDLFGKLGASRGKDITSLFNLALIEDPELAIRISLWGRDVRSGAGERKLFRDVLQYLEKNRPNYLTETRLLSKVPELGRWDDLLVFQTNEVKSCAYSLIETALREGNGLCAKWMPRQGKIARELREHMGMTPKRYRKTLVSLTKVVETLMCSREFEAINFNHVPSLAMSRYTKSFKKHAPAHFEAWKAALVKGDPKIAKVNAGAVYPYDVVKTAVKGDATVADAQWEALPNYIGDAHVLPLVDVSGSMNSRVGGGKSTLTAMEVAISLGMYCASKNTGAFKDIFLTFSSEPEFITLRGTLSQRYNAMVRATWGMSTDLEKALTKILDLAVANRVSPAEMPSALLIMSDMQFNQCVGSGGAPSWNGSSRYARFTPGANPRAIEMIRQKYRNAGYEAPAVIFWNIDAHDNVPVKFDESGTALVSGFSPSIMKSVLAADLNNITPEGVMRKTVMTDRYDFR